MCTCFILFDWLCTLPNMLRFLQIVGDEILLESPTLPLKYIYTLKIYVNNWQEVWICILYTFGLIQDLFPFPTSEMYNLIQTTMVCISYKDYVNISITSVLFLLVKYKCMLNLVLLDIILAVLLLHTFFYLIMCFWYANYMYNSLVVRGDMSL